jgi:hypothetical protein
MSRSYRTEPKWRIAARRVRRDEHGAPLVAMIERSAAALAAALAVSTAWAQAPATPPEAGEATEELCGRVLCRQPTTVKVLLQDKRIFEVRLREASPIVLPNGWVTVLPGEQILVAFDLDDDEVRNPRALAYETQAKNTLSFRFTQDPGNADSILFIRSSFEHPVKFDLGMMLPNGKRILRTSSCPVRNDKGLAEHWPHPIFQIVAARFRVLPPGSPLNCE